jgi:hypothetical protein
VYAGHIRICGCQMDETISELEYRGGSLNRTNIASLNPTISVEMAKEYAKVDLHGVVRPMDNRLYDMRLVPCTSLICLVRG